MPVPSSTSGQPQQTHQQYLSMQEATDKYHPIVKQELSTLIRLNKIRVQTTQPVARVLHHTNRHIFNGLTGLCSYVEKITNPYKADLNDTAARQNHNIKIQKQRNHAIKAFDWIMGIFGVGAVASSIAGMIAPPAQIAALSFSLASLVSLCSKRSIAQLALNDLRPQLMNKPSNTALFEAAKFMKLSGKKLIQTDNGLATRTDLVLRAYDITIGEKKRLLDAGTPLNDKDMLSVVKHEELYGKALRDILIQKNKKRTMKTAMNISANNLPKESDKLAQLFGSDPNNMPVSRFSLVPVEKQPAPEDKIAAMKQAVENAKNPPQMRPMTKDEQQSLGTVVDFLRNSAYSSFTSRPHLDVTLRNLEWRQKNNQKDWLHLLVEHKAHDYEQALNRYKNPSHQEQDFSLMYRMESEQEVLKDTAQKESQAASTAEKPVTIDPKKARNPFAQLAKNGIDALEVEDKYLKLPTVAVALNGLGSLTKHDWSKFEAHRVEAMSKSGKGLIYLAQSIVKKNKDLFADKGDSFRPLQSSKDLLEALKLIYQAETSHTSA